MHPAGPIAPSKSFAFDSPPPMAAVQLTSPLRVNQNQYSRRRAHFPHAVQPVLWAVAAFHLVSTGNDRTHAVIRHSFWVHEHPLPPPSSSADWATADGGTRA